MAEGTRKSSNVFGELVKRAAQRRAIAVAVNLVHRIDEDAKDNPAACNLQRFEGDRALLRNVAEHGSKPMLALAAKKAEEFHQSIDKKCDLRAAVDSVMGGLKELQDNNTRACAKGITGGLQRARSKAAQTLRQCVSENRVSNPGLAEGCESGLKIQDLTQKICHATGQDKAFMKTRKFFGGIFKKRERYQPAQ